VLFLWGIHEYEEHLAASERRELLIFIEFPFFFKAHPRHKQKIELLSVVFTVCICVLHVCVDGYRLRLKYNKSILVILMF